ncbi:DUF2206 domain-containing protein [Methanococcoides seepicolus]|uniref:DUF2206 domain-containing protein n=1 Tax=Methanococcoides seepicolus TaxID=2828780 RepID=A0A9E5DDC8_9EURY|nr:DUF2206 domain-containing protein [Methanococcoides seepicolus]MCM1987579.1 DUF2206 domain-containing protein [Methanococcoides seepicolus]
MKIDKISFIERFVLSVGLSVSLLFFVGLLLNFLSVEFGYLTPLSLTPLLVSFNVVIIALSMIGYKFNKDLILFKFNLNLSTLEKLFLSIAVLFPALSIFGMFFLNSTGNNIITITFFVAIFIYLILVCIFNYRCANIYPYIIFLMSISLLLLYALRSNHIIGIDSHLEYYFFQNTMNNMYWSVLENSILDASLSISLLPTICQIIFNTSSEFLFKVLYVLIYSISPLIVYIMSKKYLGEFGAFLAACFFMFQYSFLTVVMNARTSIAIFFFALALMVLFNDKINQIQKRALFIIFMVSIIMSHYSTAYIFIFIMSITFIIMTILAYMCPIKKIINGNTIALLTVFIVFWYSLITGAAFNSGVLFIQKTFISLNQLFIVESRGGGVPALLGDGIAHKPIADQIEFMSTWLTFIFIGIGIVTVILHYKEMSFPELNYKKSDTLKIKFESGYFVIALICTGLLFMMVALPFISKGYGIQRLYAMTLIILSVFFVLGIDSVAKIVRVKPYLIFFLIVIPYFFSISGVTHSALDMESTILLDSEGEQYHLYYVYDQESYGAKWMKDHSYVNSRVFTDFYGRFRLISQGNYPPKSVGWYNLKLHQNNDGYIYLRAYNVIYGKFVERDESSRIISSTNLSDYDDFFINKNLIYNNNGTEIYI